MQLQKIGKHAAGKLEKRANMSARFAEEEEDERAALADADWAPIAKAVVSEASAVASDASKRALEILKIDASDDMFDQVSQDAIDWARERGAELVGKKWRDGELVNASDADDTLLDETRDQIRAALAQALEDGDSAADLGKRIEDLGAFSEERAARIAQTELVRASNQGHMAAFRGSGVVEKKSWSTSNEESVCEVCEGNEDEGALDLEDDFPSGDDAPPAHPGCLPGNALVLASGRIAGATKRWYDGDLVVIRTASGKELACTPNHPILTHGGFIAARLLHEGDEIFSARKWVTASDDNGDDVPTSIHEVAESFRRSGQVTAREVPTAPEDFHGDGGGSQVAVVWADSLLRNGLKAKSTKTRSDRSLDGARVQPHPLDGRRTLIPLRHRGLAPTSGPIGGLCLGLSDGLGLARHLEPLRFTATTALDAGRLQDAANYAAVDVESNREREFRLAALVTPDHVGSVDDSPRTKLDASALQGTQDRLLTDAVLATEILDTRTSEIFADPVVSVWIRRCAAHVFNLQTTTGWYVANGIVTHNCMCVVVPEIAEQDEDEEPEDEDEEDDEAAE